MKKYLVRTAALLAPEFFSTLLLATALALGAAAGGQEAPAKASAEPARRLSFEGPESLAGWTVTGDAGVDAAKSREGKGGSLRIGPGGKAVLKLREPDASGKLELRVYDDGSVPANARVSRVGPRWGLVQSDGRLLAAGVLYASYLGGSEGYTVTASDGKDWFDQLFWLGVNRAPAGWHKWTFDFDAEEGLQVFHNDRELGAVDSMKTRLKGFNAIAIWGDAGKDNAQTIWVADPVITLGGPVKPMAAPGESDPYLEEPCGGGHLPGPPCDHLHGQQRAGDPQARRPPAQGPHLAIRHHLDIRPAGPGRAIHQRRLVRNRAGDSPGHRPKAAVWERDSQARAGFNG